MKRAVAIETDQTDSSTETESLKEKTPRLMSDHEVETSTRLYFALQIKAVNDPLTQQIAHLCKLMQELRNEQALIRHEETASLKATSSTSGNAGHSETRMLYLKSDWTRKVTSKQQKKYILHQTLLEIFSQFRPFRITVETHSRISR